MFSDCLSNLFIHEDDVILSLYFIQSTNKPAHPNIRRLYYPAGKHIRILRTPKLELGPTNCQLSNLGLSPASKPIEGLGVPTLDQ